MTDNRFGNTASIFSEGDIRIIIAVAVVVAIGVVTLVIVKKNPALTDGTEKGTDEEE